MLDIKRFEMTARMSQLVVSGGFAFVAGQVSSFPGASIEEQTADVFQKIVSLLGLVKAEKSAIVSANIWLTDVAYFDVFNRVWDNWLTPGHSPSRVCVQAQLMKPGLFVEVSVVAKT